MKQFADLAYTSHGGLTAELGHPNDDPYDGNPRSSIAQNVFNDRPVALVWKHGEMEIKHSFTGCIQAAIYPSAPLLVVVGHWGSELAGYPLPNNGVVFNPDGSVHRKIMAPSHIVGKRYNNGGLVPPEALSLVTVEEKRLIIWLAYWQGTWHEQRVYDPTTGSWGEVVGQYYA